MAAAGEARSKGVDDAILLNAHGRVCEATSSNIIWLKDDIVFVPPLNEGQVNGTLQKILCTLLRAEGWEVSEKPAFIEDLLDADELFLTNAIRGIQWVRKFENKVFGYEKTLYFYGLMEDLLERLTVKEEF